MLFSPVVGAHQGPSFPSIGKECKCRDCSWTHTLVAFDEKIGERIVYLNRDRKQDEFAGCLHDTYVWT